MPRGVVGNPLWIAILEREKEKAEQRYPDTNVVYSFARAIKELKKVEETYTHPGEAKIKYLGPKFCALIVKEMAKGFAPEHFASDATQSSSSPTDPRPSKGATAPRQSAKARGKQRAMSQDDALPSGAVGNTFKPTRDSSDYLILIGMYSQCHERSQKVWMPEDAILACGSMWGTLAVDGAPGVSMSRLLSAGMVLTATQNQIHVYALTWSGYKIAEKCALERDVPKINIIVNDLRPDWQAAPKQPAAKRPSLGDRLYEENDLSAGDLAGLLGVPVPVRTSNYSNAAATSTVTTSGISRDRMDAMKALFVGGGAGVFSSKKSANLATSSAPFDSLGAWKPPLVPRQDRSRAAPPSTLSSSPSKLASTSIKPNTNPALKTRVFSAKPVQKKVATGAFANVYREGQKAVAAPATDVLAFLFSYLNGDNKRVTAKEDADIKQNPVTYRMMYKVEFRSRQARHPLAAFIQDKEPLVREQSESSEATEIGWLPAERATPKCPGIPIAVKKAPKVGPTPELPPSRSSAAKDLLAGARSKANADPRAMYRLPNTSAPTGASRTSSSPDKVGLCQPVTLQGTTSAPTASTSQHTAPSSSAGIKRSRSEWESRPSTASSNSQGSQGGSQEVSTALKKMRGTVQDYVDSTAGSSSSGMYPVPAGAGNEAAGPTSRSPLPASAMQESRTQAATATRVVQAPASVGMYPSESSTAWRESAVALPSSAIRAAMAVRNVVPAKSHSPSSGGPSADPTGTTTPSMPLAPLSTNPAHGGTSHQGPQMQMAPLPDFDPVILQPDTFYVKLIVDGRETQGLPGLASALERARIPHVTNNNIVLGDYVWVAKRKVLRGDGYDEVVLAVCERKRKDDFVGCIKSGRYKEQKQRIKAAGVQKCFYLVEDCDISHHESYETFIKGIQTSICQTQIVDDFTLNVALSAGEAVGYLAKISKALQGELEKNRLYVIPNQHVDGATVADYQKQLRQRYPKTPFYTSLGAFEHIGRKQFTVRSVWAKMLCSVQGVAEELAEGVMDLYPTPISMFCAMEERMQFEREQGREEAAASTRQQQTDEATEAMVPGGAAESAAVTTTTAAAAAKKRKTVISKGSKKNKKCEDVTMFAKNKLDRSYRPRPMNMPTSARLWNLFANERYVDMDDSDSD